MDRRDADRGPGASVLGRALARHLPDVAGSARAGAALVFVLGSYVAAEQVRKRRRARLIPVTPAVPSEPEVSYEASYETVCSLTPSG